MKRTFFTLRELSSPERLNRSTTWLRGAIRHGKLQAEKVGNAYMVHSDEVRRVENNMPTLTYEEMHGKTRST